MNIKELFASKIHKKIILFFHENPASVDTLRGISVWVGYDRDKVKAALEDLVEAQILIANKGATTIGYAYTQDPILIKKITAYIKKGAHN